MNACSKVRRLSRSQEISGEQSEGVQKLDPWPDDHLDTQLSVATIQRIMPKDSRDQSSIRIDIPQNHDDGGLYDID